jgi:hypothetical protein
MMLSLVLVAAAAGAMHAAAPSNSVFYPAEAVRVARANMERHAWARAVRDRLVQAAEPWRRMSDEQLWSLMFGNTIKRSWMVWSNGHCPSCKRDVPMYTWEMDALARPWKVRCPHCKELFPKNDFAAFYQSGLDEHNVFDPARADRSLLFNAEHPEPGDPLRSFGVDDGEGYVDGDKRWRFIGAYLIYGQWKQAVLGGIRALAAAYLVTGDRSYAHKAGVLLDRVADLYPSFDFGKEGVMYEGPPMAGYVSTWHDACEETRWLALAYDQVRDALADDAALVAFLSERSHRYGLANPKATWADIRRNIEDGILRDAIKNRQRIYSNYPRTEIALATILIVLGWPENRADVFAIVDPMLQKATAVDGVTGEKGLAGYSAYTIQGVAGFLAQLARMDPALLADIVRRHPKVVDMFRFFVDTWCFTRYYPTTGDTGSYAAPVPRYAGAGFSTTPDVEASMFTLMGQMYRLTRDPVFAQLAWLANGRKPDGLPHDLFCADPASLAKEIASAVKRHGAEPVVSSVNKEQWRLAIMRSGKGDSARAVWLDYDAGGAHGHADALNLGMYAFGLDLLPDFGYPPVQFGGWGAPRAVWYKMTAAHNTVVVDGANQHAASGDCTLWAVGKSLQAIRARCAGAPQVKRYERTVALCDAGQGAYVVDVFRVKGGSEHVKFQQGHFGTLEVAGVALQPEPDFGHETQMRAFRAASMPESGAQILWTVQDRLKLLPPGRAVMLNHWELTRDAHVGTCEGWLALGGYNATEEFWIPRLFVRRRGQDLASTFVAVMEPHTGSPAVRSVRRLDGPSANDGTVALEIVRSDGLRDILIIADAEAPRIAIAAGSVRMQGDLCRVTLDSAGHTVRLAAIGCTQVSAPGIEMNAVKPDPRGIIEVRLSGGRVIVETGQPLIRDLRTVKPATR